MIIQTLTTDYAGKRGPLFWLALKTSVLTVLTLGFYRFWMKTRLRRFYWSSIRPGGIPLEYTGTAVEKLMGFLIAVVFLAFYIGVFNLILVFLSFSLLNGSLAAYILSFVGLIPIYFYAQYRARRYVLARTRWRGLRFGIDPAAWGYAGRALLHWGLTILTLGVLLPRQVFKLEKFRIDRTWFGRERFTQQGRWTMLLPAATHYFIGLGLTILAGLLGAIDPAGFGLLPLGLPWLLVGWLHFRIRSFHIMAAHKRLGENIGFTANPRTWRVIRIYLAGGLLIWVSLFAIIMAAVFAIMILFATIDIANLDLQALGQAFSAGGQLLVLFVAGFAYFGFFILGGVLRQIFLTQPMMHHYAETLIVGNSHHLNGIAQRPRDEFAESEGFAEALDIGAAI